MITAFGPQTWVLIIVVIMGHTIVGVTDAQFRMDPTVDFYSQDCPRARGIVARMVLNAIRKDQGLPAVLLRMQFHDCFVRGCDASILLDSEPSNLAEKDGPGNAFSMRGYEVIDSVKEALEAVCPGTVSCADIITLASRDAIASIGGPSWPVRSGRYDGLISRADENGQFLPPPGVSYSSLLQIFARKGFSERELVVLSGAHTIGVTHCSLIQNRLYNGTGPDNVDPTLDPEYAVELKKQCKYDVDSSKPVFMDPTNGGHMFDNSYYNIVLQNKGIFISDATLVSTASGREIVETEAASSRTFFHEFAVVMERLSNLEVKNRTQGEIRIKCHIRNQLRVATNR